MIPPDSSLRARFQAGKLLVGTWITIPAPALIEGLGKVGLDLVIIDLEHGELGLERELPNLIRAAAASNLATIVRVPTWQLGLAGRILDAGIHGLVVPQLDDAATVAQLIKIVRFPPVGIRGISTQTRAGGYGTLGVQQLVDGESGDPVVFGQIESVAGFRNLASILSTTGLDGILLGPNDLSLSLKAAANIGIELNPALEHIALSTLQRGLVLGSVCADLPACSRFLNMGARLLVLSTGLLWKGYSSLVSEIRNLGH